ncbi:hypothetical protein AB1K89_13355 [Sporosarcina sp. 179-K 8C2 HS]|uniref:hypothetical protein n=1 Tax=Sporosarcina sp. 179-K 8C2 HS TaxID=3142387 RepID=UPI0039A30777
MPPALAAGGFLLAFSRGNLHIYGGLVVNTLSGDKVCVSGDKPSLSGDKLSLSGDKVAVDGDNLQQVGDNTPKVADKLYSHTFALISSEKGIAYREHI